jgi:hypothetical protein
MHTVLQSQRKLKREQAEREALSRASRPMPNGNDAQCILEFSSRGIPVEEIETFGPGQNVFTYKAWRAKGRQVRKGEKSVKLTVWHPIDSDDDDTDRNTDKPKRKRCRPVTACVFHVSQTDPAEGAVTR